MIFETQISRQPNHYPWTKDFIKVMWEGFWTSEKFNFESDKQDFKNIPKQEQDIIIKALSAIAQIEVQVKRFWSKIGENLPHPSIESMGIVMAHVEEIHNDAYEKLLLTLGLSDIFNENLKEPVIINRVNYLTKHTHRAFVDNKKQFIYSLILFTLFIENVSLFSQFYIVLWFNKFHNLFKDTAQQIKYTRNEELIHADIGIKLIQTIREEYPNYFDSELEKLIYKESLKTFESEERIIDWILGGFDSENLNAPTLKTYIANRINESLERIGYSPIINIQTQHLKCTSWFDESLYSISKVDFFHSEPTSYTQSFSNSDDF